MMPLKSGAATAVCLSLVLLMPLHGASAAEDKPAASTSTSTSTSTGAATPAVAKSEATPKKRSKAEIEAMLSKCSDEADAKGLSVARGKGAARKAFRRECMHRMGVDPR